MIDGPAGMIRLKVDLSDEQLEGGGGEGGEMYWRGPGIKEEEEGRI